MITKTTHVFLLASALGLSITGCRHPNDGSSLEFAHATPDKMLGSPAARLELIKSGIPHNFGSTQSVCIQRYGKNNYSDESLILETKLAYAMWLHAASYSEVDFKTFSFIPSDKCQINDAKWAAVVALADLQKEESGDNYANLFAATSMSCGPRDSNSYACQSDKGIALGWGGPGIIGYSYVQSNPQKWTSVKTVSPSSALLSPHVDWQGLDVGIDTNEKLTPTARAKLKIQYSTLLATTNQSFAQLVQFGNLLAQNNVILGQDQGFTELMRTAAEGRASFTGKVYRPKLAAFHTLLHELGHTFGLQHADNPAPDAITGQSGTTTYDEIRKQHITKVSAMGYADQYAYLTEDDRLGVQAATAAIKVELNSHR